MECTKRKRTRCPTLLPSKLNSSTIKDNEQFSLFHQFLESVSHRVYQRTVLSSQSQTTTLSSTPYPVVPPATLPQVASQSQTTTLSSTIYPVVPPATLPQVANQSQTRTLSSTLYPVVPPAILLQVSSQFYTRTLSSTIHPIVNINNCLAGDFLMTQTKFSRRSLTITYIYCKETM